MERSGMKNLQEHEGMVLRFFVDRRWRSPQNDSVEVEMSFWLAEGEEESLKHVRMVF